MHRKNHEIIFVAAMIIYKFINFGWRAVVLIYSKKFLTINWNWIDLKSIILKTLSIGFWWVRVNVRYIPWYIDCFNGFPKTSIYIHYIPYLYNVMRNWRTAVNQWTSDWENIISVKFKLWNLVKLLTLFHTPNKYLMLWNLNINHSMNTKNEFVNFFHNLFKLLQTS